MIDRYNFLKSLILGFVLLSTASCSHKYNSNELDLSFYQWNMWAGDRVSGPDNSSEPAPPGCGWEEFNRGVGKLVRIPAAFDTQFPNMENRGVLWYHCRFTLPELWEARTILLHFEDAGPRVDLFLNDQLVDSHLGASDSFDLDISKQVYYTRDNHLAIKVTDPKPGSDPDSFGIMGKVVVKSSEKADPKLD